MNERPQPRDPFPGLTRLRLGSVVAAAALFGVLAAIGKGQDAGARDALGNLSAPWLLLAFLAGAAARRLRWAPLLGIGATAAGLAGFYTAESVILDLGRHPWLVDLRLALAAGHLYFLVALASGPIFGTLGALWALRRSASAAAAIAAAFAGEPLAVWLSQRVGGRSGDTGLLTQYPAIWVSEPLAGLALALIATRRLRNSEACR